MEHLPDQLHIDRIRDALWQGREFGRAAVVVGAGFSLNARPRSMTATKMPTWAHLASRLIDILYPEDSCVVSDRERALEQAKATSGALRLAEEYQAAFGRESLEAFLKEEIPDEAYEPSNLHKLLLKLPWSDIFTTNFDTLLERGKDGLIDRKYDVVRTIAEIPGAMKPRIIKLHGSFPSTRPFIFTEEDFRTYPRQFAPFVNLAQQVIMENVVCLIGFSGDDPNFLYWTGWVRDNLGKSAPYIYLCDLLDLSPARRKMLYERNVVPIDLSPHFPVEKWPDRATRYSAALEWFLLNLEAGQPPSLVHWPHTEVPTLTPSRDGMPSIPKATCKHTVAEPIHPERNKVEQKKAEELIGIWAGNREKYPGWLILPYENRENLWIHTKYWIDPILHLDQSLPFILRLRAVYELNWRLEKCLVPLWTDMAKTIASLLANVDPFKLLPAETTTSEQVDFSNLNSTDWSFIRMAWAALTLALLHHARESQDEATFAETLGKLDVIKAQVPQVPSIMCYQQCLFDLARLDYAAVRALLHTWPAEIDDPYWDIRRAAVLAEIGEIEKAKEMADRGLAAIRAQIRPDVEDFPMLSREGWAMLTVRGITSAQWPRHDQVGSDFPGRWERLRKYRCSPQLELDLLEETLKRPVPPEDAKTTETVEFDPGQITTSLRFSSEGLWIKLLPALQATRLIEDSAYPPNCSNVILSRNLLVRAAAWLQDYVPEIAMSLLLRNRDDKAMASFFNRHRVASLSGVKILTLHRWVTHSLFHILSSLSSKTTTMITHRNTEVSQIRIGVELLSRIAIRLPDEILDQELLRAIHLYQTKIFEHHFLHEALGHLVKRILWTLPNDRLDTHILELAGLPIPGIDGFHVTVEHRWEDPLRLLPQRFYATGRHGDPERWSKVIHFLLRAAESEISDARSRAVLRLTQLHDWKCLSDEEKTRFGATLWKQRDSGTGLPAHTNLYAFSFLHLPEPEPGLSRNLLRQYCLKATLSPIEQIVTQPDGKTVRSRRIGEHTLHVLEEILGATSDTIGNKLPSELFIDWTNEEASLILGKIVTWWAAQGETLLTNKTGEDDLWLRQDLGDYMHTIFQVLRKVVVPRWHQDQDMAIRIKGLIEEIEKAGWPTETMLPVLLKVRPEMYDAVVKNFRKQIVTAERRRARAAVEGIYLWLIYVSQLSIPGPPRDLLYELGNIVQGRRQPALDWALLSAAKIIAEAPEQIDPVFIECLYRGLEFLLQETDYRVSNGTPQRTLETEQIPRYRELCAKLAGVLNKTSYANDSAVQEWLRAAQHDPLPEVRYALVTP